MTTPAPTRAEKARQEERMADVEIGDAILAGIGSADTALEQMTGILMALDRAGYDIVRREPDGMAQAFEKFRKERFGAYAEYPVDAATYFAVGWKACERHAPQ